jgi:hypothetical protein
MPLEQFNNLHSALVRQTAVSATERPYLLEESGSRRSSRIELSGENDYDEEAQALERDG